jgi:hypothetical protein
MVALGGCTEDQSRVADATSTQPERAQATSSSSDPGSGKLQASFANATPAQLMRVYAASSGSDLEAAILFGASLSGSNDTSSCPTIVTTGQDTIVTGGCSTKAGDRVEGSISVHSTPSQLSTVFDYRVTTSKHENLSIVGHAEIDMSIISGDLKIEANGMSSSSHLTLACTDDGACAASPDSGIELSDLGNAGVEGKWSLGTPPSGQVTVRGADVITFDVANRDKNLCVPYTVAGKNGSVCLGNTAQAGGQAQATAGTRMQRWSRRLLDMMKQP